ncbi:MAG: glycosyltransferase [Crenarchaeota archaeon]|nr:glycosyltransferase [Thermoproteota archaeon]
MRVAYISTFPPAKCGIGEYTYDLVTSILNISHRTQITILRLKVKEGETDPSEYELDKIGDIVDVGLAGSPDYEKILREIRERGPFDVIHIQHEYSLFPWRTDFIDVLRELKKHTSQLIITLHTVRHVLHNPGIDEYQRKICEIADVVIVHSSLQEMELLHQGAQPDKIVRIPHGTRILKLVSKVDAVKELNLPVPEHYKIILVQGFLRRDKGLHIVLKAMDLLVNEHKQHDAVLLVAGQLQGEDNRQYVEEFMRSTKNMQGRIIVLSKYLSRKEINLVYSASDVVVFPYVDVKGDIGVSGAFHVALGSFKPVICARVPRLIECYELAPRLTFPPANPEALAAKLSIVLSNYEKALQYMKPLIQYAYETSWINVAKMHLRLYSGVEPYMIDIHYEKLPAKTETMKISRKVPVKIREKRE